MRLLDVANRFNKTQAYDAYSGAASFKCQLLTQVSGTTANSKSKRALSCTPGTVIPTRRAATVAGDIWVIGDKNRDEYMGSTVRENYPIEKSSGLLAKLTPAEACLSSAGTTFHAYKDYLHAAENKPADAEYDNFWNLMHYSGEGIAKGKFVRDAGGILYVVVGICVDADGFTVAKVYELDSDALQSVTFSQNGTYNPTTDSFTTVTTVTTAVQMAPSRFYRFHTREENDTKPGDLTVFLAASALTPKVGAKFTMFSKAWQVLQVDAVSDAWAMRVRLA